MVSAFVHNLNQTEEPGSKEEFAELVRRVKSAGLLERRSRLYVLRIFGTSVMFFIGWVALFFVGASWWSAVVALYLGFASAQVGFLAHDAGHRQAFRSKRANEILLLVTGNLLMGVSGGWWFGKHHRHHAHPNNIALDPDVRVSFFSYAPEQQHEKQGIRRISSRFQHILYFPMATLQAWSLHFAGTLAIIRDRSTVRRPGWELAFLFVHAMAYFVVLATVLSLVQFVVFVFVHQAVFGVYLASTFAPNHKGMAMFTEEPPFLRHQVLTARNVTGGGVVAFLTGGLNYQIEHHLFPAMPRPNLKRAQPIVQEFCEEIGLSYAQANVWKSFGLVTDFFRRECLR